MHNRKLGLSKIVRRYDGVRLSKYMDKSTLPAAPPTRDWGGGVTQWGMMRNDALGDCTIAGAAHAVQTWTLNTTGKPTTLDDSTVVKYYSKWTGYIPGLPATDRGGIELDVLKRWRRESLAGHQLLGYADPTLRDEEEVVQSINLFGGLYIGFDVPACIMSAREGETWDVVPDDGGIDGGHCVFVNGYDEDRFKLISWGGAFYMTKAFWCRYVGEAHALLSMDWLNAQNISPVGFDRAQLQSDLSLL